MVFSEKAVKRMNSDGKKSVPFPFRLYNKIWKKENEEDPPAAHG
jgi:hypothetical protein